MSPFLLGLFVYLVLAVIALTITALASKDRFFSADEQAFDDAEQAKSLSKAGS